MPQTDAPLGSPSSSTLAWYAPPWSAIRQQKKFAPLVFGRGPVIRAAILTLATGAVVCGVSRYRYPEMPFEFIGKASIAFVVMYLVLGCLMLLQIYWPDHIEITPTSITHTLWSTNLSDIDSAQLIMFSPNIIHLKLRIKAKTRTVAVPQSIDFEQLSRIIPLLSLRDRQAAFRCVHQQPNVHAATAG